MIYERIFEEARISGSMKILFVCLGNICRSPAAEGVMDSIVSEEASKRHLPVAISCDSAGTARYHIGEQPDRRMRIHARDRGIALNHRCRQVCTDDFFDFDLIVGMDSQNIRDLHRIAPSPEAGRKIVAMADFLPENSRYDYIPDPYYEGAEGFELVFDLLSEACRNLFDKIEE